MKKIEATLSALCEYYCNKPDQKEESISLLCSLCEDDGYLVEKMHNKIVCSKGKEVFEFALSNA